jgi:rhodanese-related sulfurtransferase
MLWFSQVPQQQRRVGFDDVLLAIQHPEKYVLINTLAAHEQQCLIQSTMPFVEEEAVMNQWIASYKHYTQTVIVYGKHGADIAVDRKYQQLTGLGFREVYVYAGGMLEWMLLQDVFGATEFPTTSKTTDILRFQAPSVFKMPRLTN